MDIDELRQERNECHEALKETQKVMERLKLSFSEVSKKDHSGSVIEGSQKVYAGLTYGPGSRLNETVIR